MAHQTPAMKPKGFVTTFLLARVLLCLLAFATLVPASVSTEQYMQALMEHDSNLSGNYRILKNRGDLLNTKLQCRAYLVPPALTTDALRDRGWTITESQVPLPSSLGVFFNQIDLVRNRNYEYSTVAHAVFYEGRVYLNTQFSNYFVPDKGVIVARNNFRGRMAPTDDEHWSDVVFAQWREKCQLRGMPISGLKRVVRAAVTNRNTVAVWMYARGRRGVPQTFLPTGRTSGFFSALLGAPNGYGLAYMLLTYSAELGEKTVTSITMQDDGVDFSMIYEIGDAPAADTRTRSACCIS